MRWSRHDRGTNLGREGVRVRPVNGLALLFGDIMAAKKKSAPRKKAPAYAAPHPASTVMSVAIRSLINMAIVTTSCATTLLALMAAFKFQMT
jgi:hypothetical protein